MEFLLPKSPREQISLAGSPTIKRLTEQQKQNVIYNTRCSTQFIIIHALAAVFAPLPTIAGAAVKNK